jgi:RNA polymerase sigma-70 factor (ECF subfamily)
LLVFDDALLEAAADAWEELLPELQPRTAALHDCIRRLPGRAGELIQLRYLEALKLDEVAARLGMSAVAARVALNRVRAALRDCVERKLGREALA